MTNLFYRWKAELFTWSDPATQGLDRQILELREELQRGEACFGLFKHQLCAVTILNSGRVHNDQQHQAQRVDQQMLIASRDFFPAS